MEQVDWCDCGERRLVCAVLVEAIKDSQRGTMVSRHKARQWICSDDAKWLASLVGFGQLWPPPSETFLEVHNVDR